MWFSYRSNRSKFNIAVMKINIGFLCAALLFAGNAGANNQDADFLAARDAYRLGNQARLQTYAVRLQAYPLSPYVQYWQLQLRLKEASTEEVRDFLSRNADTPLADRLRGEWMKVLGKMQNWPELLKETPALQNSDTEITCYVIRARLSQGEVAALKSALPIWMSGRDLPESCSPLFDQLIASGIISTEDIWARLRLALEAGNISVAKNVALQLPQQEVNARTLDSAANNPQRFLEQKKFNLKTRAGRELVMFALHRIARTQPQQALPYWNELREQFSDDEQAYVWGQLALHAARKHDALALSWFKQADDDSLSDLQLGWKVRTALRVRDWTTVLETIEAMSESEQALATWRYWQGRALKELGDTGEANLILAPLSREHHFYGQLALEELGVSIGNVPVHYQPSPDEIKSIQNLPGIQRALLLNQLDLAADANREWLWTTRGFDDKHLLAAAEVARRNNWLDRAINTADKTVQLHDFSLRFLAPHRNIMQTYTRQWKLDEAWVYGLMRQESRFVTQARSRVGASGLMQIMPATASWIARRLGMKGSQRHLINQVETNIEFGTYYLKYVLDNQDGHPVLATAAYNAGPSRATRWRDAKAMEGAIYAESVPFTETRDYVKKVMSNATYYAARFGQQIITLKQRLGTIPGKIKDQEPGSDAENQGETTQLQTPEPSSN